MPPAAAPSAFLVVRRDGGAGEAFPLQDGVRYLLGRAPTNRIVLRDDLCSREHAEVYRDGDGWAVRDLGSLNGTHVNGEPLHADRRLKWLDEVRVGRSELVFTADPRTLPPPPVRATVSPDPTDGLQIKKRLGQTRYMTAGLPATPPDEAVVAAEGTVRANQSQALSVLYKLALDMADAATAAELAELVLDALFRATPSEVGAVLALKDGRDLEPVAYRLRHPGRQTYHRVSSFVSMEALASKQAVLAENVAGERNLKNRDSIAELKVASLICAPIPSDDQPLGLLHLYRTSLHSPLNNDDLEFALAVARQLGAVWHKLRLQANLAVENKALKDQLRIESELVGESPALRAIETQISRVAETKATVLIRGESGCGKELVARAIHRTSPRKGAPFVCLNCAALTETLLESELFGHEKGAFTGATERMAGKFEAADGGTIFLDEIGEMAAATQAKFLRVLEGHPFERVGGNVPITADVRVVAATNRPLEEAVRAGSFRRDLFFRLQVVQLDVPPLRDRADDVPRLADHFLKRFVRETGRKIKGFTPAALDKLRSHRWPGNVRELRNVVERAVALGGGSVIDAADVWLSELDVGGPVIGGGSGGGYEPISLDEVEKRHIADTLRHTDWNKSQAAAILGGERSTLGGKFKAFVL